MGKTPAYKNEEATLGRGRKVFNIEGPYYDTYARVNPKVHVPILHKEVQKKLT